MACGKAQCESARVRVCKHERPGAAGHRAAQGAERTHLHVKMASIVESKVELRLLPGERPQQL
jgi:hypothetical protein